MSTYIHTIVTAIYVFPFLAAAFTLPYIFRQYHKYGALLILRIAIVYTFIFYMMTSWFMTVLPLPPIDSVTAANATVPQLVPFAAVHRWLEGSGIVFSDIHTYWKAMKNPEFYEAVFNVLLLVPFGVYLRYYFRRPWWQVFILSFMYSLFFELTQLSGLYGIYKYSYRYFDVDDLICNTLGGVVGFLITPAFALFLPSRERLDEKSYRKGENVSVFRRITATAIDVAICFAITVGIVFIAKRKDISIIMRYSDYVVYLVIFITFVLTNLITGGYTLGKFIVNIRLRSKDNKRPKFYKIFLKYLILSLFVLPAPYVGMKFYEHAIATNDIAKMSCFYAGCSFFMVAFGFYIINVFINAVHRKNHYFLDNLFDLKLISTVHEKIEDTEDTK